MAAGHLAFTKKKLIISGRSSLGGLLCGRLPHSARLVPNTNTAVSRQEEEIYWRKP
jgi:hypothetical protein